MIGRFCVVVALAALLCAAFAQSSSAVVATATSNCGHLAALRHRDSGSRSLSAVQVSKIQKFCFRAHTSASKINFWYSKPHRWTLYLNQPDKKCWELKLAGPEGLCLKARAQVRIHSRRLAKLNRSIQKLTSLTSYLPASQARGLGQKMAAARGWVGDQWNCLDTLWGTTSQYGTLESGWDVHADNPTSPAYGIPQADPGSKMLSAGRDWLNSAYTQIKWGLKYIFDSYGSPCSALHVRLSQGSY